MAREEIKQNEQHVRLNKNHEMSKEYEFFVMQTMSIL